MYLLGFCVQSFTKYVIKVKQIEKFRCFSNILKNNVKMYDVQLYFAPLRSIHLLQMEKCWKRLNKKKIFS